MGKKYILFVKLSFIYIYEENLSDLILPSLQSIEVAFLLSRLLTTFRKSLLIFVIEFSYIIKVFHFLTNSRLKKRLIASLVKG